MMQVPNRSAYLIEAWGRGSIRMSCVASRLFLFNTHTLSLSQLLPCLSFASYYLFNHLVRALIVSSSFLVFH